MILEQLFNDREKEEINRFVNNPTNVRSCKKGYFISCLFLMGQFAKRVSQIQQKTLL